MVGFQERELTKIIEIDRKKCKGCDACKTFCPTDAVEGKYGSVHKINTEKCVFCGQCLVNCPFGAPTDIIDNVPKVKAKLTDPKFTVVATVAPAVRVAIGEEFGLAPGTLVTEKLYGALKQAGFKIMDVNFTADQTIMEEGTELINKVRCFMLGESSEHPLRPLPQLTSCCPAWIRLAELNYPEILPHISSAKSPMMMAGVLAKTYGAINVWTTKPENMYVVGIMPCTAKKFEASRPEFQSAAEYWKKSGEDSCYPDIDCVLTTRDLARLLKELNVNFSGVTEYSEPDNPLTQYSGAGTIFGNTGGVMEAALRTAHYIITGRELDELQYSPVRGLKGVKATSVALKDAKSGKEVTLQLAVVHGAKENIRPVIEQIVGGRSPYHFIEVMNCPGGCVNGGGQPINPMGTSWLDKFKTVLPWA